MHASVSAAGHCPIKPPPLNAAESRSLTLPNKVPAPLNQPSRVRSACSRSLLAVCVHRLHPFASPLLVAHPSLAAAESRSLGLLKEAAQQAALGEALALCRQLAVSYVGLMLTLEMFPQVRPACVYSAAQTGVALSACTAARQRSGCPSPLPFPRFQNSTPMHPSKHQRTLSTHQCAHPFPPTLALQPPEAAQRGALQLLDSLDAAASSSSLGLAGPSPSGSGSAAAPGGAVPMPPGFLEDFAVRFADEGLPDLLAPIGELKRGVWLANIRELALGMRGHMEQASADSVMDGGKPVPVSTPSH